MAKKHTVTKSKPKATREIRFTKYNTGLPIIIVSLLYLFCYFFAKSAPVFVLIQQIGSFVFGLQWLLFIWIGGLLYGILVWNKPWLIVKWGKQFLLLSVFISGVVNFAVLEDPSLSYTKYGGYISAPLLEIGKLLFSTNFMAIEWIIVIWLLLTAVWILMSTNIELPSMPKVQFKTPEKPEYDHQIINNSEKSSERVPIKQDAYKNIARTVKESADSQSDSDFKSVLKTKLLDKLMNNAPLEKQVPKPIITFPKDKPTFPVSLLHEPSVAKPWMDTLYIESKAEIIKAKLAEFGIAVEIAGYNIWPAVVQIKLQPQSGVKMAEIERLKNDLMGGLKTKTLRILAPIVGTEYVGIEIPNPSPVMVRLSEVLGSSEFVAEMGDNLTNLALGKGIDGKLVIKSLEKMPHLLIAGATGQGKSVGVNDFILSLMYQNNPGELKFIMVDPKQVEMELYSGLPYLLCPIITDPEKALRALKWATVEMDTRYGLLKQLRVKNLQEYNDKIEILSPEDQAIHTKMSRIVVVIDELADLMMSGKKKDVELCITRIAQKARAVGMHLIVATQRPSVNVITGLIKANMPTRISFGVVSNVDSRTILDMKGAEDLIGKGDMLYMDPTSRYPIRVQAPFVDTPEIEEVVNKLKSKYMKDLAEEDVYDPGLMKLLESHIQIGWGSMLGWGGSDGDADDETLVQQAMEVISKSRRASTTALQRHLKIGFARAGRIMDILEERGIVWPQEGGRPREVLI